MHAWRAGRASHGGTAQPRLWEATIRPEPAGGFDLPRLLRTLDDHGVEFVVIGGVAGNAHGSTSLTTDLDICYAPTQPNVRALLRALRALHARQHDGERLSDAEVNSRSLESGDLFAFETDAGPLDCVARPRGTDGFDDLVRAAATVEFAGVRLRVAALDDLIRMKRAVGRPSDLIEVEVLGAVREELDRREDRG